MGKVDPKLLRDLVVQNDSHPLIPPLETRGGEGALSPPFPPDTTLLIKPLPGRPQALWRSEGPRPMAFAQAGKDVGGTSYAQRVGTAPVRGSTPTFTLKPPTSGTSYAPNEYIVLNMKNVPWNVTIYYTINGVKQRGIDVRDDNTKITLGKPSELPGLKNLAEATPFQIEITYIGDYEQRPPIAVDTGSYTIGASKSAAPKPQVLVDKVQEIFKAVDEGELGLSREKLDKKDKNEIAKKKGIYEKAITSLRELLGTVDGGEKNKIEGAIEVLQAVIDRLDFPELEKVDKLRQQIRTSQNPKGEVPKIRRDLYKLGTPVIPFKVRAEINKLHRLLDEVEKRPDSKPTVAASQPVARGGKRGEGKDAKKEKIPAVPPPPSSPPAVGPVPPAIVAPPPPPVSTPSSAAAPAAALPSP
ncbi:MAG: hypothetical protein A2048_08875 [Deltaproteobacteria bacterium GWA2_45_12]|nr:MAG: hypothetical protein A2048_08875 [Deltaproteobacteria bacterium GWA2_45_12]